MGTLTFTATEYARSRGSGSANITGTNVVTSDVYTTSTSASNVEDGSGDITLAAGQVFEYIADEPMWINFGGAAATVGDGFYVPSGVTFWREVTTPGTVSVIDVS